jgi:excisionase family DNA binding protein
LDAPTKIRIHSNLQELSGVLTAGDVARILKCSKSKVYQLREEGDLRARFKLFEGEKGWRWTREDVERYLNARMDPYFERFDRIEEFVPVKLPQ